MSTLHSYKKLIKKYSLIFEPEMYTNTYGSVVITAYINNSMFNNGDQIMVPGEINKKWRNLKRNPEQIDFWIDDDNFIEKTLDLFGFKKPEVFNVAMVQSNFNVLFMPYFENQVWPLREDGVFPQSAHTGKIYPISFTNNNMSGEVTAKKDEE